jgi:hypothetical protein
MNFNINIPGVLQVNFNGPGGGPGNISEMLIVPHPVPKNNYGKHDTNSYSYFNTFTQKISFIIHIGVDNQNLFPDKLENLIK